MKIKLFSIFLVINLIFSSYANATTIAYDTKMRVGKTWNTARTAIKNNPFGKNPQGFILTASSVYIGDRIVTEYQNGTFDAPLASMKNAIAEMYAAGVEASGWLQDQFNELKKEFVCDSNGNCTAAAKQADRTFNDTKFAVKNSPQFFDSIAKALATSTYATSPNYNGYQVESIAWGSKTLTDAMNSPNKSGDLTVTLSISCVYALYCGNKGELTDTRTITIVFDKVVAEPKQETTTRPVVLPSDMAQTVSEPDTEQKQVEVIATCYLTNCSSINIQRSEPSSVPQSYLPNGSQVDIKYPSPPIALNADGTIINSDGAIVQPNTGAADSTTGVTPNNLSDFCSWAKPVCDLKNWLMDTDVPEPEVNQVQDIDTSKAPEAKVWNSGTRQCPPSPSIPIGFLNKSITLELTPFCDFLSSIRNFILASAYLGAAFIIFNYRRS